MQLYQLLPLASAFGYSIAALLLKRSLELGAGEWRTVFLSNISMGVCFLPLWCFGGTIHLSVWYQPVITAAAFFLGQLFTFLALSRGDVSIATPVLGLKAVLVAFFTVVLVQEPIRLTLWLGAGLTTVAVGLLSATGRPGTHRHVAMTLLFAILSATAFALTDTLVQKWAKPWGVGRYIPIMFAAVAVLSFGFLPFFRKKLREIPGPAWPWLASGCLVLAAQALGMASALTLFGRATEVNILYNSRGIWSVVLVWIIGHWFRSQEQHLGRSILTRRLAGSILLLTAIFLVLR